MRNKHTLVSWIGANDLKVIEDPQHGDSSQGPVAARLAERSFDSVDDDSEKVEVTQDFD